MGRPSDPDQLHLFEPKPPEWKIPPRVASAGLRAAVVVRHVLNESAARLPARPGELRPDELDPRVMFMTPEIRWQRLAHSTDELLSQVYSPHDAEQAVGYVREVSAGHDDGLINRWEVRTRLGALHQRSGIRLMLLARTSAALAEEFGGNEAVWRYLAQPEPDGATVAQTAEHISGHQNLRNYLLHAYLKFVRAERTGSHLADKIDL